MRAASVQQGNNNNAPIRCECGYMYVIGNCGGAVTTGQCPQCNREIGGQNYNLRPGQTAVVDRNFGNADEAGYIADDATAYGAFHTARELSALSYRVLHLLTHLSLYCAPLLGYDGLDRLVTGQGDPAGFCWTVILRDLSLIAPLLNGASEETCAWLRHHRAPARVVPFTWRGAQRP